MCYSIIVLLDLTSLLHKIGLQLNSQHDLRAHPLQQHKLLLSLGAIILSHKSQVVVLLLSHD